MRCFLIFKLLILFVIQVSSQKDFIVKTDLLGIPIAIINKDFYAGLSFEKGLKKNYSLNLDISYGLIDNTNEIKILSNEIINSTIYFKKYTSKSVFLKKWYWGGYVQNQFRIQKSKSINGIAPAVNSLNIQKYNYSGIGGLIGYQFLSKRGFCLDAALGAGMQYLSYYKEKPKLLGDKPKSIIPGFLATLKIGYNFSNLFKTEKNNVSTNDK